MGRRGKGEGGWEEEGRGKGERVMGRRRKGEWAEEGREKGGREDMDMVICLW